MTDDGNGVYVLRVIALAAGEEASDLRPEPHQVEIVARNEFAPDGLGVLVADRQRDGLKRAEIREGLQVIAEIAVVEVRSGQRIAVGGDALHGYDPIRIG